MSASKISRQLLRTTGAVALLAVVAPAAHAAGDPVNGKFTIEEAVKGVPGVGKLTATIKTSLGDFSCELFEKDAPGTVANFVGLARGARPFLDPVSGQWVKRSFYDGLTFHRVIPTFMIQGGDIKGNGTGEPGYTIVDEKNDPHKFDRGGVLAMANRGPNTAGSQFFITEGPTPALDDGARPGAHYQIFGQCGPVDLVKKIAGEPRDGRDKPLTDIKIVKITVQRGEPKADAKTDAGKGDTKGAAKGDTKGGAAKGDAKGAAKGPVKAGGTKAAPAAAKPAGGGN